jgi:hypothetical protein
MWLKFPSTRDELYAVLLSLGVNVELAPRGDWRENFEVDPPIQSSWRELTPPERRMQLGVIVVHQSPIQWINVYIASWGDCDWCVANYAIPDPRLGGELAFSGLSIFRRKRFRWVGPVVDVVLRPSRLMADDALKLGLMHCPDIIVTHDHRFWAITQRSQMLGEYRLPWKPFPKLDLPTLEIWRTYEAVANYLLTEEGKPPPDPYDDDEGVE